MDLKDSISKIGYSDIGGIFIGKNIISEFHKHYALSVIISFGKPFKLRTNDGYSDECQFALIQKNINFSLETFDNENVAFIHIAPFSTEGIVLTDSSQHIKKLAILKYEICLGLIKDWYYSENNSTEMVKHIIHTISNISDLYNENQEIDSRMLKAIRLIMESNDEKLHVANISSMVNLSTSHFNRLFKRETGVTFRKFVLHSKLIKSISAIHKNNNLTQASYMGGFADQAHLTRTFKENFGIKPSKMLK